MGPRELAKFLQAPNRIMNANEVAASRNEETKALHDLLMQRMMARSEVPCSIVLVWATSGYLSASAKRNAESNSSRVFTFEINDNAVEVKVSLQCLDLEELVSHHEDQQNSDDLSAKCDIKLLLEDGTYHQTTAVYPTLYMTLPVKHIIDVFARHRYKIFQLNPRGPLGNKVNKRIRDSLLDDTKRKQFHLLNNGITAICEEWKLENGELDVRGFQIINGCQTTMTLWDARAIVQTDPEVLITVKLTGCPQHLAADIADATNRQTALRAEDFRSNEDIQIKLQREFLRLSPPWFYQIKRGEWSKMIGGQPQREGYRDPEGGYRQLNIKDVAQAVVAFAGFPGEAKDKIGDFLERKAVPSIAKESEFHYSNIYNDHTTAVQLLLPALIQRRVKKQANVDKAQLEWVEYARFHIVWLIGDILKEHYGLTSSSLFPASRASVLTSHLEEWFGDIYHVAVAAITNALNETRNRDEFTGYREFFRSAGNYRAIESNRQGALRLASNFANPVANLPV